MSKYIKVKCKYCNIDYYINISEYNRKIKNGSNFFCSGSYAAKYNNQFRKSKIIIKKCKYCNKEFTTKNNSHEVSYCSRKCASLGSVNENRINAGKLAAKMNFTPDTHNIYNIQNILKKREDWKYQDIKRILNMMNIIFEFEFVLNNYIYDLALINEKILVEFDGPEHIYYNESDKNNNASNNRWRLIRINVNPNEIYNYDFLFDIIYTQRQPIKSAISFY